MKRADDHLGEMTRRGFGALLRLGATAAILPAGPAGAARLAGVTGAPVVGFHADAPYFDRTGRDIPYLPPAATGRFVADAESLARIGVFL